MMTTARFNADLKIGLLLIVLTLLVFARAGGLEFLSYDDNLYVTDFTVQAISFPPAEARYTLPRPLNLSGKSVKGSTFTSPFNPQGLSALPIVMRIGTAYPA